MSSPRIKQPPLARLNQQQLGALAEQHAAELLKITDAIDNLTKVPVPLDAFRRIVREHKEKTGGWRLVT